MANTEHKTKRMTVVIAGRSYPVKVSEAEAHILPMIEKQINDKIQSMQMSYKDIDVRDCISMVLLTQSLDLHKPTADTVDPAAMQKIDEISAIAEDAL